MPGVQRHEPALPSINPILMRDGELSTIDSELRHIEIVRQNVALFEIPRDCTKLPLQA